MTEVSAREADMTRERKALLAWSPARSLLASIRCYQRHQGRRVPHAWLLAKWAVLRHRFWSVVCGAEIPLKTSLGGGLLLPHPNGVVIHPAAVLGPNCLVFQQVTIGTRGTDGAPQIGGHVDIGAGAKILGPVRIGDHAVIGANAVVLCDVPDHCVAVGIPARVSPRIRQDD